MVLPTEKMDWTDSLNSNNMIPSNIAIDSYD